VTRPVWEAGLIRTIAHRVSRHDWELGWDPRGLRLTHDAHTVVLGVLDTSGEYLASGPPT
jgi:hypothetical protein